MFVSVLESIQGDDLLGILEFDWQKLPLPYQENLAVDLVNRLVQCPITLPDLHSFAIDLGALAPQTAVIQPA